MTRLFKRDATLLIGSTSFRGLRISFTVKKTAKQEPNTAEITVSNLSTESLAQIKQGVPVRLLAGYENTAALIFSGDVRTAETRKPGPDQETLIRAADGDAAYRDNFITSNFAPGAGTTDVIGKIAGALGVDAGEAMAALKTKGVPGMRQYHRGTSVSGKASQEMTRVLSAAGLEWSIQDGKLQILAPAEVAPGTAILLTPDTGLVDSPELNVTEESEKKGKRPLLKLKSLLQPEIRPGVALQVQARGFRGLFRAENVEHTGDTYDQPWYTEIEARPL